jgi:hypothetical protein
VVSAADLFSKANSGSCSGGFNLGGCGADLVAYIAAHETGHFLGLSHPTEMEGADFDTIADTPKCSCISCAAAKDKPNCGKTGVANVTAATCVSGTCGGGDNLMFWLLQPGISAGNISSQQAQLMRLNPLVH